MLLWPQKIMKFFENHRALISTCQVFSHSVFDLQLALGLSSEAGIVDDSLSLKLAGKGIKTGRKVEICSLDVCFGVDFGRIFG